MIRSVRTTLAAGAVVSCLTVALVTPTTTYAVPPGLANPAAAAPRAAQLTVDPARPIRGERTVFSGRAPRSSSPVALQRRSGSGWKDVARGKVGASGYRIVVRIDRGGRYRVHGSGFTSGTERVRLARQTAALVDVDAPFVLGLARTVEARVSPARESRKVLLQALAGGTWETVASARSDDTGHARIRFEGTTPGTTEYRVRGAAYHGAGPTRPSTVAAYRTARTLELASGGTDPGQSSTYPAVSADDRWVGFASQAQLLPSDNDAFYDIYVLDRVTGALDGVLLFANGTTVAPALSADGRFVAFQSQATNLGSGGDADYDVFVLDRSTSSIELISRSAAGGDADGRSTAPAISDDGRFVAYGSTASNMVEVNPPPDTVTRHGWFYDRSTDTNRVLDRAGLAWGAYDVDAVALSGDGSRVAFTSANPALGAGSSPAVFTWDVADGVLSNRTNRTGSGVFARDPALSGDGDTLVFATGDDLVPADNNGDLDVYVLPVTGGSFELASPVGGDPSRAHGVSADGRYVLMTTRNQLPGDTNGLSDDVAVWDRVTQTHLLVSHGNESSLDPAMSGDGSVVAYASASTDLVPGSTGDSNVYSATLR